MAKALFKQIKTAAAQSPVVRMRSHMLWFALLILLAFITYQPVLNCDFTNWDDDQYVVNNPDIKAINVHTIAKLFSSSYVDNYQPITMLSYMLDYSLTGLKPSSYHGTNLALHIVNALLVYMLFFLLTGSRFAGGITALLFVVHPLRVESVAWVAERKDMLFALFYLSACILYLLSKKSPLKRYYFYAVGCGILAMLSKSMAVSLPFALILIDYYKGERITLRSLKNKIPFFAAATAIAVIALFTQKSTPAFTEFANLQVLYRWCIPFYGCVLYVFKTILPVHLSALYYLPSHPDGLTRVMLIASPFIVLVVGYIVWHFRKRSRLLVFAALWFSITLLPVLQIVPVGNAIAAERYTYISMLGIYAVLAVFLYAQTRKGIRARLLVYAGCAVVVLTFSWQTFARCTVWNTSATLWSDTVKKNPSPVAFTNLGLALSTQGGDADALSCFNRALALKPNYALALNNRGVVFADMGDYNRAAMDFNAAIVHMPSYADAYVNRGMACAATGRNEAAIADFTHALALAPQAIRTYNERGIAYAMQGHYEKALADFDSVLIHDPSFAGIQDNRNRCAALLYTAQQPKTYGN